MELSEIARLQKRVLDWRKLAQEASDAQTKSALNLEITKLQALLESIWRNGVASEFELTALNNLERVLDDLNEQSRLRTTARFSTGAPS